MLDVTFTATDLKIGGNFLSTNYEQILVRTDWEGLSVYGPPDESGNALPPEVTKSASEISELSSVDVSGLQGVGAWLELHIPTLKMIMGSGQDDVITVSSQGSILANGGGGDDVLYSSYSAVDFDGGAGNDALYGASSEDTLRASAGDDTLDGGTNLDRVIFSGLRADYDISYSQGQFLVTHARGDKSDGIERIRNVELFVFQDESFNPVSLSNLSVTFDKARVLVSGQVFTNADSSPLSLEVDSTRLTATHYDSFGNGEILVESDLARPIRNLDLRGISGTGVSLSWHKSDAGRAVGTSQSDSMSVIGMGEVTLMGGGGHDRLYSFAGSHELNGGAGGDLLWGMDGQDILIGGKGNDTIDGGTGDDVAIFLGNRAEYRITFANGAYTVVDMLGRQRDGKDIVSNVETFVFADGAIEIPAPTNLIVTRDGGKISISGVAAVGSGGQISASQENGMEFVVRDNADSFSSTALIIATLSSDDASLLTEIDLRGLQGAGGSVSLYHADDFMFHGSVRDDYFGVGGYGQVTVDAGAGNDRIFLQGQGDDLVTGGAGDDEIYGGEGQDTAIFSGARSEYLITQVFGDLVVSHIAGDMADGTDRLSGIEHLTFADLTISADALM